MIPSCGLQIAVGTVLWLVGSAARIEYGNKRAVGYLRRPRTPGARLTGAWGRIPDYA